MHQYSPGSLAGFGRTVVSPPSSEFLHAAFREHMNDCRKCASPREESTPACSLSPYATFSDKQCLPFDPRAVYFARKDTHIVYVPIDDAGSCPSILNHYTAEGLLNLAQELTEREKKHTIGSVRVICPEMSRTLKKDLSNILLALSSHHHTTSANYIAMHAKLSKLVDNATIRHDRSRQRHALREADIVYQRRKEINDKLKDLKKDFFLYDSQEHAWLKGPPNPDSKLDPDDKRLLTKPDVFLSFPELVHFQATEKHKSFEPQSSFHSSVRCFGEFKVPVGPGGTFHRKDWEQLKKYMDSALLMKGTMVGGFISSEQTFCMMFAEFPMRYREVTDVTTDNSGKIMTRSNPVDPTAASDRKYFQWGDKRDTMKLVNFLIHIHDKSSNPAWLPVLRRALKKWGLYIPTKFDKNFPTSLVHSSGDVHYYRVEPYNNYQHDSMLVVSQSQSPPLPSTMPLVLVEDKTHVTKTYSSRDLDPKATSVWYVHHVGYVKR